jgi:hypothetical protein
MARLLRIVVLALWAGAISPPPAASAGPSLIQNYRGKPTGFGIGFRDHLLELRRRARR